MHVHSSSKRHLCETNSIYTNLKQLSGTTCILSNKKGMGIYICMSNIFHLNLTKRLKDKMSYITDYTPVHVATVYHPMIC